MLIMYLVKCIAVPCYSPFLVTWLFVESYACMHSYYILILHLSLRAGGHRKPYDPS